MTISFKVSKQTAEKMKDFFKDSMRPKTPPYAVFQADSEDTVVTLYESGKVVFQGISADIDANLWKEMEKKLNPNSDLEEKNSDLKEKEEKDTKYFYKSAIGSDEVGTGDFFGPIVVTAAYVNKKDISYLKDIGVGDSKKISDLKIMEIVPKLKDKVIYESIILNNKDYNNHYGNDNYNMNKIKAIMHNKVLTKMKQKNLNYEIIIIDQFAKKDTYFNYLKESSNVVNDVTFLTKAEEKNLSVACAAIISRYIFLKEFKKISDEIGMTIPKGAGNLVDEIGKKIVEKYGIEKLNEIAKINFKNYEKIKTLN